MSPVELNEENTPSVVQEKKEGIIQGKKGKAADRNACQCMLNTVAGF